MCQLNRPSFSVLTVHNIPFIEFVRYRMSEPANREFISYILWFVRCECNRPVCVNEQPNIAHLWTHNHHLTILSVSLSLFISAYRIIQTSVFRFCHFNHQQSVVSLHKNIMNYCKMHSAAAPPSSSSSSFRRFGFKCYAS